MAGIASSACTKCISDVPGFMKQTSTPAETRLSISDCAPFIVNSATSTAAKRSAVGTLARPDVVGSGVRTGRQRIASNLHQSIPGVAANRVQTENATVYLIDAVLMPPA